MAALANRDRVEGAFVRKMSRLSSTHRKELRRFLGDPPDVRNVPGSFWQKVQREVNEEAATAILLIYMLSARRHGLDSGRATSEGLLYAQSRATDLSQKYATTSAEMTARFADGTDTFRGAALEDRLVKVFGPNRDSRVVVSETTETTTAAGERAIELTVGKSSGDRWITTLRDNVCPICQPLHGTSRDTWSSQFPLGPQAHINCYCWIDYVNMHAGAAVPNILGGSRSSGRSVPIPG